ncbi:hypothetical protein [Bacillus sp. MUM 13]|nr:hypothetical protein [Bacillus sp. MUM 13]
MIIEREFTGTETVEGVLLSFVDYVIDKMLINSYDNDRTNVTSENKGVAE